MPGTYIEEFEAAHSKSTRLYGAGLNPPLVIDRRRSYGAEVRHAVAADLKDGVVTSAIALAGQCFRTVRETSYVLFEMGINNALTIGCVTVDGSPYFTTTEASLAAELREGFAPGVVANAHAWLTLDSGQVLDATLLPSIAHHRDKREISIEEAVHLSGGTGALEYRPLLTGFAYHLSVVAHPIVGEPYARYCKWLEHVAVFQRNIERRRCQQ